MPTIIKAQGDVVWGVFDEDTRLASGALTNSATSTGASWAPDFILERVKMGDFQSGNTLAELAGKCGITNAKALENAVANYNADLPKGRDREFLRELDGLRPIAKGPFYAFQYRACDVNLSGAGMRIDADAHVLDNNGDVIPGLFAAGEAGAGVLGERYVGGGNSVANALTMGRVAGRTIARESGKAA
jgi:fumarate reductase flavoprotein subunit